MQQHSQPSLSPRGYIVPSLIIQALLDLCLWALAQFGFRLEDRGLPRMPSVLCVVFNQLRADVFPLQNAALTYVV